MVMVAARWCCAASFVESPPAPPVPESGSPVHPTHDPTCSELSRPFQSQHRPPSPSPPARPGPAARPRPGTALQAAAPSRPGTAPSSACRAPEAPAPRPAAATSAATAGCCWPTPPRRSPSGASRTGPPACSAPPGGRRFRFRRRGWPATTAPRRQARTGRSVGQPLPRASWATQLGWLAASRSAPAREPGDLRKPSASGASRYPLSPSPPARLDERAVRCVRVMRV